MALSVPRDLSIVGFDDISIAAAAVPSLTTVRMPTTKIAAAGVELAVGDLAADWTETDRLVFKPKLIVRRSTSPVLAAET